MIVDHAIYRQGKRDYSVGSFDALNEASHDPTAFAWVGLAEPTDAELREVLGSFTLHETALEDAINAQQRARIEVHAGILTFVIKTVFYDDSKSSISTGELICFLHDRFIITVRHGDGSPLVTVRHELESKPDFLAYGPFAVLFGVLDKVITEYSKIALELEIDVNNIEQEVFSEMLRSYAKDIYLLKREVIEYRHAIDPLILPLQKLLNDHSEKFPKELIPFFQDITDEVSRACEHASAMDSLLTAALHVDLSQMQVRQNIDVRRISAWVALASFPTMVAGIYGMNFEHMPELRWKYGYPLIASIVVSVCGFLFYKFRKSKWL